MKTTLAMIALSSLAMGCGGGEVGGLDASLDAAAEDVELAVAGARLSVFSTGPSPDDLGGQYDITVALKNNTSSAIAFVQFATFIFPEFWMADFFAGSPSDSRFCVTEPWTPGPRETTPVNLIRYRPYSQYLGGVDHLVLWRCGDGRDAWNGAPPESAPADLGTPVEITFSGEFEDGRAWEATRTVSLTN